jgi:hypothetical protein
MMGVMRTAIGAIAALVLVWIGYVVWPLYDLYQLALAIETRNVAAATQRIDFGRVRVSLAQQITEAYIQRTGARVSPLITGAVGQIADPFVIRFVSPETLAEMLRVGWPDTVLPDRPRDVSGLSLSALGSAWQLFIRSDYGIGQLEVSIPVALPPDRAFGLKLRLVQWRWRLSAIRLPANIQSLIVDEIIKSIKPPQQPTP